ncbi:hypothetical protein, partial [Thermaurantiacus sp.]
SSRTRKGCNPQLFLGYDEKVWLPDLQLILRLPDRHRSLGCASAPEVPADMPTDSGSEPS